MFIQANTLSVNQALAKLTSRERRVLMLRLSGGTLKAIGLKIESCSDRWARYAGDARPMKGIGKERTRQIYSRAISKLKRFTKPPDRFSGLVSEIHNQFFSRGASRVEE